MTVSTSAAADRFAGLLDLAAPMVRRRGTAPPPPRFQPAARLLVRDGLHHGAWMSLHGERLRVGSADDSDIVLTDTGMPPLAAHFVRLDNGWQLEVVDNNTADPPSPAAAGESMHGRWRRRRWQLHGVTLVLVDAAAAAEAQAPQRTWRHLGFRIGLGVGIALVAIGAVVAMAHIAAPSPQMRVAQALPALLALKLPDVQLRRNDDGAVELTGQVNTPAEFEKLRDWLQGSPIDDARLRVQVGSAMADQVREALGSPPDVKIAYTGGGHVRVEGSTRSAELKRRVQTLVGDMRSTVLIDDQLALIDGKDAAPVKRTLPIRVVNVMLGEAPYFQTDTGNTYFVGSTLPDGAEVIAIAPMQIVFRLDEREIVYRLDN